MPAASLTFLAPAGALLCLAALAPLGAVLLSQRRVRRLARGLRLQRASARGPALRAAALVAACVLLGLAVARPALRTVETQEARTDAQAFFVLDVSRSMLASPSPSEPSRERAKSQTRLERAKELSLRLRGDLATVPSGVAGLTDRVLPYVFPTSDERVFASVVRRAVAVDSPPPREVQTVATSFDALAALPRTFFPASAKVRLCVVLTDGESRPFSTGEVGTALLASPPCRLVVIRVGNQAERIYDEAGRVEAQYRPREEAGAVVEALAAAAGGRAFEEGDVASAARTLRELAGSGPTTQVDVETRTTELAPYLALAACALVLLVVLAPLLYEHFVALTQRSWIRSRARA
jgi:hypothetical protein